MNLVILWKSISNLHSTSMYIFPWNHFHEIFREIGFTEKYPRVTHFSVFRSLCYAGPLASITSKASLKGDFLPLVNGNARYRESLQEFQCSSSFAKCIWLGSWSANFDFFKVTCSPDDDPAGRTPSLDILFSSNHNIQKSSFGLCFWASDSLIDEVY